MRTDQNAHDEVAQHGGQPQNAAQDHHAHGDGKKDQYELK
jgi:hypothetical protein